MTADKFTCPRRFEDGTDSERFRHGGRDRDTWQPGGMGTQQRHCSYCGSMPGEEFMAAVKSGVEIGPTDKNYKAYVGGSSATGKFYFQHLPEDDRIEFIKLLNQKMVRVGWPGHFYVLPFFIAVGRQEVT